MSFHEKSAWVSFISIAAVFGPYFWLVLTNPFAYMGLLPLAVIALVVLLTILFTISALSSRSVRSTGDTPPNDEMHRMITLRSAKLSGLVLAVVVVSWCLVAPVLGLGEMLQLSTPEIIAPLQISLDLVLRAVHMLFAGFIIANLVYYASVIVQYRGLAHA